MQKTAQLPNEDAPGTSSGEQNPANDMKLLAALIERHYSAEGVTLQPLASESGKRIYRVDRANGPPWVLRISEAVSNNAAIEAVATVLRLLEKQAYPAERIVRSVEQEHIVTTSDGWQLLMTTFIEGREGRATDYSPATLRLLGARLGQLHALSLAAENSLAPLLPLAEMRPAPEISWALGQLTSVAAKVPSKLQPAYDSLVAALHSIDPCENLPQVFIHNDCHPSNTVYTQAGEVVLLDWEGAGLGPAVLDVGFLLVCCYTESPWTPMLLPDPARVNAIIDGYCLYHRLTAAELEKLPDAMRFRSLVYGAWSLADAIVRGGQGLADYGQRLELHWWWRRYLAADELAERAKKQFVEAL